MDQRYRRPLTLNRRRFLKGAIAAATTLSTQGVRAQNRLFPAASGETILVAGAGLAGLSAAHRLREAGKRVIVIEARAVPGGRVRTVREFDGGLFGELGAARIADTHEYALHWIGDLSLSLTDFQPAGQASILAMNGLRARSDDDAARARLTPDLHADERGLTPVQLLLKYIAGLPNELASSDFDPAAPRWAEYDRVTWPEWLRMRGASESAITIMTLGGHSQPLSALYLLRQILLHKESRGYMKIEGGMDRLPRAIAQRLAGTIRYNSELTRLERTGSGVRATVRSGGRNEVIAADRAVLAIPLPTLRRITIDPPFPAEKTRAIAELPYYEATRFLIQTKTRFWEQQKLSGTARTDAPADIWDMGYGLKGTPGLLSVTTGGPEIEAEIAPLAPAASQSYGKDLAEAAFPEIATQSQKILVHRWMDEPYARGAFSVFYPGHMSRLTALMAKPEGRVHFAGEHLAAFSGWMEGALWSGETAAAEILQQ